MEYASKGVAGAGLGTGIAGLSLGVLNSMGGLLGAHSGIVGATNNYVTKEELNYAQQISAKDAEIALLKSENNTETKMVEVYRQVETELNRLRDKVDNNQNMQQAWNASQSVANAHMSANIATNTASIATLSGIVDGITKLVVPKNVVCPEPMDRYNSWTAPTTVTAPTA